jgi:predicted membrane GTPase involved in stress response
VTPDAIRVRKCHLAENERRIHAKKSGTGVR